jgi:RNA-dependent RNA polymerase
LKFHSFRARSLELGVYLNPDKFVSEIKYTDSIKLIINYQKRSIRVEFGVHAAQQIYQFRLEIAFKDIEKIHTEHEESCGSITISNKFPARYWILDKRLQSKDKFNWCLEDSWKRKTDIRVKPKSKEEKELPLQPHTSDNCEQLGKLVVFRITFDFNQIGDIPAEGFKQFEELVKKAGEYNLVPKPIDINNKPLNIIDGINLRKYVERSMLDFDVLYMTECNLSYNFLHDYNLDEDFFSLLSQQPSQSAIYILNTIHAGKKRIYNPLSYLRSELETMKLNSVEIKPNHIPSHCVMMRKVVITPTTMYMLTPSIETSNRVIRRFRDKKDNFLRIQFTDEASSRIGSTYGTSNDALYNRIYNILCHGIKIGNRRYEFLAFSSSQLRDHSCWFFASTHDLTADDIRRWMGDFSSIHNVAKYAARMGQCFSSTRDIRKLPVKNLEEIPDIINNGYVFSDGIGKLSFSLAKKIADELELKSTPSAFQFRLAGYKGMLCQSRFVRNDQIQVRPSQHKFESNHNVLEIIRCSTFIPAYLNRQAITLLSVLGVPDKVFIDLAESQVNELDKMLENENNAVKTLQKNVDEHGISRTLADLVRAGFLQTNDQYLLNLISLFRITMLRDLKKKAKIRVEKGAFLLGVLDDTQSLKENQVYCCVSDPNSPSNRKVITGTCVVWRNPCFHPGDIRIVTAVNCKDLSNLVDVVVFPSVGYRDIPSQCSGGDLDGDDFTYVSEL